MNPFPIRDMLFGKSLKSLILLGTSRSSGLCVDLRLPLFMLPALLCQSRNLLLTLSQHLIGHRQLLKTLRVLHTKLLDIGRIGWAVPKSRELGDNSLNQLIIVEAQGSLMTFNSLEVRNPLALGSDLRPLYLLRRQLWLGLWLLLFGLLLFGLLLLRFLLRLRDGLTCQLG